MKAFAKTDVGKQRDTNEDFYYISKPEDQIQVFILADGMGGYGLLYGSGLGYQGTGRPGRREKRQRFFRRRQHTGPYRSRALP